jgi:hypothetical protein
MIFICIIVLLAQLPKLATASLHIHRSQGGFLLPSVTTHNQPVVRVYRFPTVILADPGKTPRISLPVQPI